MSRLAPVGLSQHPGGTARRAWSAPRPIEDSVRMGRADVVKEEAKEKDMFGLKRITIARHERGLVFRDRSFKTVFEPGVYWVFDPLGRCGRAGV